MGWGIRGVTKTLSTAFIDVRIVFSRGEDTDELWGTFSRSSKAINSRPVDNEVGPMLNAESNSFLVEDAVAM